MLVALVTIVSALQVDLDVHIDVDVDDDVGRPGHHHLHPPVLHRLVQL